MIKQNKKVMLIEPPFYRLFKEDFSLQRHSLSMGYLAAAIKKFSNQQVQYYNADFSEKSDSYLPLAFLTGKGHKNYLQNLKNPSAKIWAEIEKNIKEVSPSAIGLTVTAQGFASALNVAKIAKRINKKTTVIAGGPHATLSFKEILKHKEFDVCVIGEGEQTIIELLQAIEKNKPLERINGIAFRKGKKIIKSTERKPIENLDELPFPHEFVAETLKDFEKYPKSSFGHVIATRGCPNNCFFCASRYLWGRKVRFRTVKNVIEEIKQLQKKGLNFIRFEDDSFGINKEYLTELCDTIKKECGISWSCEMHAKQVNDPIIKKMKKTGCKEIYLGIESGNNEMLKKMNKNITIEEAIQAANTITKNGIILNAFFMIGLPWETEQSIKDTLEAIKKIKNAAITYSIFTPYPGTDAFNYCEKQGLVDKNYDASQYNHQSPENCFCLNLSKKRFRELAAEIEKEIDKRNLNRNILGILSNPKIRNKIRELGIKNCIAKATELLLKKSN